MEYIDDLNNPLYPDGEYFNYGHGPSTDNNRCGGFFTLLNNDDA
jgi:hypothetical protein